VLIWCGSRSLFWLFLEFWGEGRAGEAGGGRGGAGRGRAGRETLRFFPCVSFHSDL